MVRFRYWKLTSDEVKKLTHNPDKILNWEIKGIRKPENDAIFIGIFLYRNGTPFGYEAVNGIVYYHNNIDRNELPGITKFLKERFGGEEIEKGDRIFLKNSKEIYTGKEIGELVEKGEKARKNGVLSLEADLPSIESTFLRNGIELAINERDSARLRNYLNLEMSNIHNRHKMGQEIFFYLGAYAPAFGMLGTVMGLIIMMNNFSGGSVAEINSIDFDVAKKFSQLLGGMGLALITTFYGVLLANLVFLPIGGKLTRKSQEEMMLKSIVVEGIISIHSKEHPILMREKLMTFVPQSARLES